MTPPDEPEGEPLPIPVRIGEVVDGKFRVEALVGRGGMASVVAAHHLELDRPVALKFLDEAEAARPEAVRRFLAEGRAAARLESVHIAKVLDVGTWRNARGQILPYLVMELLDGCDLDAVLANRGRLPVVEAVEYVLQACEAVAEAHAVGIVHRDLKPGNLFLTRKRDGSPVIKLLDFGISKSTLAAPAHANAKALTADRELMGSPGYMSPEQVRSAKDVDARTDVWSLGVVLYELLTARMPFEADNVADLLVEVLHAAPKSLIASAPDVPQPVVDVVTRCLQKRREDRFSSIDELARALAPLRSTTPLSIPEISRKIEVAPATAAVASTIREAPKSHRVVLTAMVSVAAVGAVLGVIGLLGRQRMPSSAAASEPAVVASPLSTASTEAPPNTPSPSPQPESEPAANTSASSTPPASSVAGEAKSKHRPGSRPASSARPAASTGFSRQPPPPAVTTTPQRTNW